MHTARLCPLQALKAQALKDPGVRVVVAPYEGDAQLAYLIHRGLAAAVLTQDSDALLYGCHTVSIVARLPHDVLRLESHAVQCSREPSKCAVCMQPRNQCNTKVPGWNKITAAPQPPATEQAQEKPLTQCQVAVVGWIEPGCIDKVWVGGQVYHTAGSHCDVLWVQKSLRCSLSLL